MPLAQAAGRAATDTRDQAGTPDTSARVAVTPGSGPRKARTLLSGPGARQAQIALPAPARPDRSSDPRTESRRDSLPRVVGVLQRLLKAGGSYRDPLFERPELVEDDYYRFRNQPRG